MSMPLARLEPKEDQDLWRLCETWRALEYPTLYRKGSRSSDIKYEIRIKPSPSVSLLDLFANKVQQPFDI